MHDYLKIEIDDGKNLGRNQVLGRCCPTFLQVSSISEKLNSYFPSSLVFRQDQSW